MGDYWVNDVQILEILCLTASSIWMLGGTYKTTSCGEAHYWKDIELSKINGRRVRLLSLI